MEKTVFNLRFEMPHFIPAFLKESEITILNGIINGSRIGKKIMFYKNCTMTFDEENDKLHWNPIVELVDKFKRSKINCICYKNINKVVKNHAFDYFFVYQLKYKDTEFYGIIAYNEEDDKSVHYYGITYDYTNLLNYLLSLTYREKDIKKIA